MSEKKRKFEKEEKKVEKAKVEPLTQDDEIYMSDDFEFQEEEDDSEFIFDKSEEEDETEEVQVAPIKKVIEGDEEIQDQVDSEDEKPKSELFKDVDQIEDSSEDEVCIFN